MCSVHDYTVPPLQEATAMMSLIAFLKGIWEGKIDLLLVAIKKNIIFYYFFLNRLDCQVPLPRITHTHEISFDD